MAGELRQCAVGEQRSARVGHGDHKVVTYQNGAFCLYLNGALLTTAHSTNVTIRAMLQIGSTGWTCRALNGAIGEVALYGSALSAQQVAAHYAAGLVPHRVSLWLSA
ncbi:LamG domain-containing protein [Caballeronia sp. LZ025]|uniref:LamG domain-containing protein n=1 Tax=Caballeronia TaxID=1827195 RepID=UPI001FD3D18A|nr:MULTISPECIES: LamG domain-containing protein [Caballeronia]MDR5735851.1 LamG domain-containing protein [Caballeronia sp. LZ025]